MPRALLPSTRNGSTSLPSPFLSQRYTCTYGCLLNIATQELRRPSDSRALAKFTFFMPQIWSHSSELGHQPSSWASPAVIPPGSHPIISLILSPDVTNFTS